MIIAPANGKHYLLYRDHHPRDTLIITDGNMHIYVFCIMIGGEEAGAPERRRPEARQEAGENLGRRCAKNRPTELPSREQRGRRRLALLRSAWPASWRSSGQGSITTLRRAQRRRQGRQLNGMARSFAPRQLLQAILESQAWGQEAAAQHVALPSEEARARFGSCEGHEKVGREACTALARVPHLNVPAGWNVNGNESGALAVGRLLGRQLLELRQNGAEGLADAAGREGKTKYGVNNEPEGGGLIARRHGGRHGHVQRGELLHKPAEQRARVRLRINDAGQVAQVMQVPGSDQAVASIVARPGDYQHVLRREGGGREEVGGRMSGSNIDERRRGCAG